MRRALDPVATDPTLIECARGGDLAALEALLRALQGRVLNLAIRMLGHRADAEDATQEILLKVTTHLATWRGESSFATWVHGIAAHHLLNARSRTPRRRELSFEALAEGLDRGLAMAEAQAPQLLTAEDKLEARRTALMCTQAMLMCLDPPGRLAYVLDTIFGLESQQAAAVQGITPAAHRQRLARARAALHGFMQRRCGLVSEAAPCCCPRQLPAKRAMAQHSDGLVVEDHELGDAEIGLQQLITLGDAAAVMRGAPAYQAPRSLVTGIRLAVAQVGMLKQ